ncbi:hypothetical protein HELRODRAFT_152398, partial [Helobdella robusta]|uniref:Ubiquitin-like protease family profile domain-containing protein n=1 Tax=Helobdella robusta TaxID=6412 RepID=T1EKR4_HELRO
PCILIFDSLKGDNRYDVVNILRQYLQVEWNLKKRDVEGERVFDRISMKGSMVNCPQQPNSSDCGIYVLQYVESFFLNPISDFTLPLVLPNWFTSKQAMSKRLSLSKLVMKL